MASRPVHPLLVAFLALLLVGTCQARPAPGKAASSSLSSAAKGAVVDGITDIYNFGDSISDTGNFLALMEHTVAPPYMHNVLLQQGIRELRRSYPEATIAYADYSGAYVRMLEGARDTGFDGVALTKACCGGKYNFEMERISWDGVAST
ncbi:hypothetical protein OsI_07972 [Oryza sativa Indica Group]|uniref:Uncharacterized protein n=1 Tax=Oryza sativa subsp. indica TaxID=39946 RepID=A2X6Y2_ORYSI|nr:hypothetical protein OsI_07972 [Oryza sativa Indica Group]